MISERAEWLKALRAVPVVARALTTGLTDDEARRRPAAGEWAVVEIVAHMADTDERALGRVERMLAEAEPNLPGFDQAQLAVDANYVARSLPLELDRLEAIDRRLGERLQALDDAGWMQTGRHAEHGEMTVEQYVAHVVAEDIDHLAQLARTR